MLERIIISVALIGLGVLVYRLLLSAQRRSALAVTAGERASGRPALLVFTSPTCAPCKLQQMPIVDRLMAGWGDRIGLRVIDVTEQPDVAAQYGVWSLPTTIVLDARGRVEAINQGVAGERKLQAQFERVCQRIGAYGESTQRRAGEPAGSAVSHAAPGGRG